eukprot:1949855-Rhodomonas_salina.1
MPLTRVDLRSPCCVIVLLRQRCSDKVSDRATGSNQMGHTTNKTNKVEGCIVLLNEKHQIELHYIGLSLVGRTRQTEMTRTSLPNREITWKFDLGVAPHARSGPNIAQHRARQHTPRQYWA